MGLKPRVTGSARGQAKVTTSHVTLTLLADGLVACSRHPASLTGPPSGPTHQGAENGRALSSGRSPGSVIVSCMTWAPDSSLGASVYVSVKWELTPTFPRMGGEGSFPQGGRGRRD